MDIFLGVAILVALGGIGWKVFFGITPEKTDDEKIRLEEEQKRLFEENIRMKTELEQKFAELGKLSAELAQERNEKNEATGKNKQLWAQNEKLQNSAEHLQTENNEVKKQLSRFEAEKEQREKEFLEKIEKLEHSREKLEKEQQRVIREDEEARKRELEERDRLWNNHENEVIARLREVCQRPEIGFSCFDNNNLPEMFDGSFKPDFLVGFLGQYLYFDAKVSRSENLQTYLNAQFKSTVLKLKKNSQIYKNVFFIVPTEAIATLKKTEEVLDGYTFFVVSPEALPAILSSYKRITEYENLEDFGPEERETIVGTLARFEHFIRHQNTANILFAEKAFEVLEERTNLSGSFQKELSLVLKNMKTIKFKDSDFKKLTESVDEQKESVQKLTTPTVAVPKKDLEEAGQLF
ncbi:MAG: hypothetical protein WCJ84_05460 [Candidatus Peregrinibacteria bacterium]